MWGKVQYLGLEQREVFHRVNAKSGDLFWAEQRMIWRSVPGDEAGGMGE